MDNADNPPRKSPARPFFAPRTPAKAAQSPAAPAGRSGQRPFSGRNVPGTDHRPPVSESTAPAAQPEANEFTAASASQPVSSDAPSPTKSEDDVLIGELGEVIVSSPEGRSQEKEADEIEPPDATSPANTDAAAEGSEKEDWSFSYAGDMDAVHLTEPAEWSPAGISETEFAAKSTFAEPGETSESGTRDNASSNTGDISTESRGVPFLATPAFGALTVGGNENAPVADSVEGRMADQSELGETDTGDVWKWGTPVTEAGATTLLAGEEVAPDPNEPHESDVAYGGIPEDATSPHAALPPRDTAVEDTMSLQELKEVEPWAITSPAPAPNRGDAIGDALERVAKRIRDGAIVLPADITAGNDEAALAVALAALLRARPE